MCNRSRCLGFSDPFKGTGSFPSRSQTQVRFPAQACQKKKKKKKKKKMTKKEKNEDFTPDNVLRIFTPVFPSMNSKTHHFGNVIGVK